MALVVAELYLLLEVFMVKKFPCPYCKGKGNWIEVVIEETHQGPYCECGVCEGDGMIPIGGRIHQMIKEWMFYDKRDRKTAKRVQA